MVDGQTTVTEIHRVYELVLSLKAEVKGVDDKCADLTTQIAVMKEFMIRMNTLEQDRNLPAKIEEQRRRVEAIENREAEFRGQIRMLKWVAGLASFISAILGIWQFISAIRGH